MSTKVIPEKKIFICDICGNEENRGRDEPVFIYQKNGLDYSGHAVGNATEKYEMCRTCNHVFEKLIKPFIKGN